MSGGGPPRKRNFKIEAFKNRVELDPKYAERTWKVLEHAIHEIYNHNASGLSFEELYRLVHTPATHPAQITLPGHRRLSAFRGRCVSGVATCANSGKIVSVWDDY
jgi:hypothetical protein